MQTDVPIMDHRGLTDVNSHPSGLRAILDAVFRLFKVWYSTRATTEAPLEVAEIPVTTRAVARRKKNGIENP